MLEESMMLVSFGLTTLTKERSRRYPAKTITDAHNADDIAILAITPAQAETLLHTLEWATVDIVNAHKTEYMCFNQRGDITLNGRLVKQVEKVTYLGSSVSSTETDIDTWLTKAWAAIDWLSVIRKSDLTDKMKRGFFQAAIVSILQYGFTTWTLTKRMEKKLVWNYTGILCAILNNSWRQHPPKLRWYGYLPLITKTIKLDEPDIRDTAGEVGTTSYVMNPCGSLHVAEQRQGDQLEPTYCSSM